ncbi:MAG: protein kinase, partial [Acidobacteriota bacterium]
MTPERWQQVERLYFEALAADSSGRAAWLDEACAGDDVLRREVMTLLEQEESQQHFLSQPALDVAARAAAQHVSALGPGSQIGAYRILAALGAGGMGEVYRARDTQLGRDVAIKILPALWLADPGRRARFEREARLLASLNHPHIGAIYGLEEDNGVRALVLELVEGSTLEALISGHTAPGSTSRAAETRSKRESPHPKPLPVIQAIDIAGQIADALDAAHEKGIVHRDLKPANVVVTPDGTVKVLDFGLAKASGEGSDPDLPTVTSDHTGIGVVLGTAAYMSPEQARGQPVDKRTDIWAFGCVLYEMLTGRRAFEGESRSDILAAVLDREPDWTRVPETSPSRLRRLIERCLQKDLRWRLRDIADARFDLRIDAPDGAGATAGTSIAAPAPLAAPRSRRAWVWSAAGIVAAASIGAIGVATWRPWAAHTLSTIEFSIPPPALGTLGNGGARFAVSPDGERVVFMVTGPSGTQLWIRRLGDLTSRPLTGAEGGTMPFWSPDGRSIGFFAGSALKIVAVDGGIPVKLSDTGPDAGATCNRNNLILGGQINGPLLRVSGAGSAAPLTKLESGETSHRWPWFLPDGEHFLYLAMGAGAPQLRVGSLTSTEVTSLGPFESNAEFANGHLLFVRGGNLTAQPFNADTRRLEGEAFPIAQDVPLFFTGYAAFSVSPSGVLAYGNWWPPSSLVWRDRAGNRTGTVGEPGDYVNIDLSRDGAMVAASARSGSPANFDIYLMKANAPGPTIRMTTGESMEFDPAFSPDGRQLVFNSNRSSVSFRLFATNLSGGADRERLWPEAGSSVSGPTWSPDGRYLAYSQSAEALSDVWILPSNGRETRRRFLATPHNEGEPAFSPDGHWLAFQSDASGTREIYVRPFPAGEQQFGPISRGGGWSVRWRGDGSELYFLTLDGTLMAVDVNETATDFHASAPHALFPAGLMPIGNGHVYAAARDGQHF